MACGRPAPRRLSGIPVVHFDSGTPGNRPIRTTTMAGSRARELALIGVGAGFVIAFFSMSSTVVGTDVGFRPPWNNHTAGELHFWFSWMLLLVPGAVMIAAGLAPRLEAGAAQFVAGLGSLDAQGRLVVVLVLFAVAFAAARLGHALVLLDFWITDDEPAARLGGQILASGRFMLPLPATWEDWPNIFLYVNAEKNAYTSIDWTGVQLAWALAEWTGTGSLLFALAAALPAPLVAVLVGRRLGFAWGAVAGCLILLSPMALTLSFTTHAHVLSRAWIAAALCLTVLARRATAADGRTPLGAWAGAGLFFGLAFITRPFETALLCAPLGVLVLYEAIFEERRLRAGIAAIVAGAALPLIFFAIHNAVLTGEPWRPPRFAHGEMFTGMHRSPFAFLSDPSVLWSRLGNNVSYNLLMLCLWFLGPLGGVLVALGAGTDRLTRALGLGVLANLGLGLLHDDAGLHIVGPIHYSESVVPLTVLAVHGLARASVWLEGLAARHAACETWMRGLPLRMGVTVALAAVIALGTFSVWHSRGLHRQAEIHASIFGSIDALGLEDAVLLAPYYAHVWQAVPEFRETGAWVFHWPPVDPARSADVIFAHQTGQSLDDERLARLRADFPGRRFYALVGTDADHRLIVEPLDRPRGGAAAPSRDEAAGVTPEGVPPS